MLIVVALAGIHVWWMDSQVLLFRDVLFRNSKKSPRAKSAVRRCADALVSVAK